MLFVVLAVRPRARLISSLPSRCLPFRGREKTEIYYFLNMQIIQSSIHNFAEEIWLSMLCVLVWAAVTKHCA